MPASTDLSIAKIKYLKSLHTRKYRQKYNKFVVEGDKIVRELLTQNKLPIELIIAVAPWIGTNNKALGVHLNKTLTVSESDLKKVSSLSTPNKVLAVVDQPENAEAAPVHQSNSLSLYLDGIRDPGNMGTILRIADWFGMDAVFCSSDCVDIFNPKVVQGSMGAVLRIPTLRKPLAEIVKANPGLPVYGTVLEGENVFTIRIPESAIIVIGNESRGISNEIKKILTHSISIPKGEKGGAESLNAAVATGIICAQFRHRRQI